MASSKPIFCDSYVTAADLSTKQFYAVKLDATGKLALAGAGDTCIGILQNNPGLGQVATVAVLGSSKAKAGAAVTAGLPVGADANGKLANAGNGIGIAVTGAVLDDIFEVMLVHIGVP